MIKYIENSNINGEIQAPPSKSLMIRAIAMAMLSEGETIISNPSYCDDCKTALNIAKQLKFNILESNNKISIQAPNGKVTVPSVINCGESALCIRIFAPIISLWGQAFTLQAEGSLQKRPVEFIKKTFQQLGVDFQSDNGFAPISIKGAISNNYAELDGSISSQFLSGLLITLPKINQSTTLKVNDLVSKPYVDITLRLIEKFGGIVSYNTDYTEFKFSGNQQYQCNNIDIEGDWSGAAALLVAGAIGGKVKVNNLQVSSLQADKSILKAIKQVGTNIEYTDNSIIINKSTQLKAFNFDATHCPDLFPVLTALASNCKGISRIKGVGRLKHKESNRATVLQKEFTKLGINISITDDCLLIEGGNIKGAEVFANNDHRIAMALCLAGINTQNKVIIKGAECVAKTYPNFFEDMKFLGLIC